MHYYKPGQKDGMHCHNADQTFYVIDGECTMTFPDGGKTVLKPGMGALITGGCPQAPRPYSPVATHLFLQISDSLR